MSSRRAAACARLRYTLRSASLARMTCVCQRAASYPKEIFGRRGWRRSYGRLEKARWSRCAFPCLPSAIEAAGCMLIDDPSLRLSWRNWASCRREQPNLDEAVPAGNRNVVRSLAAATACRACTSELSGGESVTNIAIDLGYESPSAFIAMFRRMLGTTPARYLTETATDVNGGGKEDVIHICGDRCPHKKVQPADNVVPLSRVRNTN